MRVYAKSATSFWTGGSGRRIVRSGSKPALIVAKYMIDAPGSNALGIYYLPKATIASDTGMTIAEVDEALVIIEKLNFAKYDPDREIVWVINAARIEFGETLAEKDPKRGFISDELQKLKHAFALDFWQEYNEGYNLTRPTLRRSRSEVDSSPPPTPQGTPDSPPQGAPLPLAGVSAPVSESVSDLVSADPPPPSARRPVVNAADDGVAGGAVSAWCEGVATVTKQRCRMAPGAETQMLVNLLLDSGKRDQELIEWARAKGVEFAKAWRGKINAWGFKDWLQTPERNAKPNPRVQSHPDGLAFELPKEILR